MLLIDCEVNLCRHGLQIVFAEADRAAINIDTNLSTQNDAKSL